MPTFREKIKYGTASDLTMAWASLASDTNLLAGIESAVIDNTSDGLLDVLISGYVTVASSGLTANRAIELWAVGSYDNTSWPTPFDGTAGAETIGTSNNKNAICKYLHAWLTASTGSVQYEVSGLSLAGAFGGILPPKVVLFGTQSTGAALPSSGHLIRIQPIYRQIESV